MATLGRQLRGQSRKANRKEPLCRILDTMFQACSLELLRQTPAPSLERGDAALNLEWKNGLIYHGPNPHGNSLFMHDSERQGLRLLPRNQVMRGSSKNCTSCRFDCVTLPNLENHTGTNFHKQNFFFCVNMSRSNACPILHFYLNLITA